jgi:hypothetical protein
MRFYCTSWLEFLEGVVPAQTLTLTEALEQERLIYARLEAEIEAGRKAEAQYWAFLDEDTEIGDTNGLR